jgi:hypothetical protein
VLSHLHQLATSQVGVLSLHSPPLQILKSRITLFSGPTSQLSPFTTMACGTFRRVHITFGDVFRFHHSHLSSQLTGMWYAFMRPCPFQARNPTVRSPLQINNADLFSISGFRALGVHAPHILNFHRPKSQNLRFTPLPNWTVNYLPMIYGVDHFRISGFGGVHLSSLAISQNFDLFLDNQWSISRLD